MQPCRRDCLPARRRGKERSLLETQHTDVVTPPHCLFRRGAVVEAGTEAEAVVGAEAVVVAGAVTQP